MMRDDQTGLEMDDKGFGAEQIGNSGEGEQLCRVYTIVHGVLFAEN